MTELISTFEMAYANDVDVPWPGKWPESVEASVTGRMDVETYERVFSDPLAAAASYDIAVRYVPSRWKRLLYAAGWNWWARPPDLRLVNVRLTGLRYADDGTAWVSFDGPHGERGQIRMPS